MSYEFKKLSEVEAMTEVPEGANMIAEVNGQIRRVPAATGEGGGSGGEQTFDITFTYVEYNGITYAKADKTKQEVDQAIKEGKLINAKYDCSDKENVYYRHLTPAIVYRRYYIMDVEVEQYTVDFYTMYAATVSQDKLELGITFIAFTDGFNNGSDYICPTGDYTLNNSPS